MKVTMNCEENPEEAPSNKVETYRKIPCMIHAGSEAVNNIKEGISYGLTSQVEKNSESLGRNALYKKTSRMQNLPSYLVVQKVRFIWKEANALHNTEATRTKILRNVKFPKILDVYDFCTPEL